MAERQLPNLFEGLFVPTRCAGAFKLRSKTNLVNPPPKQGHGKTFAIALRYRFLFMAQNCPTQIFRATGGPQTILRPIAQ